jgi:pimeloyl-ACP methyl ester carboxylesterase
VYPLRAGDTDPEAGNEVAGTAQACTLCLSDGRVLAWAEYGHRHGYPLIYFHSQAGSRLEAGFLHNAALAAGFRLIAIDRPGIGQSDFHALKRHDDFSADVAELITHLNLLNPALIARAGGAPFALALAASSRASVSFVCLLAPTPAPVSAKMRGDLSGSLVNHLLMSLVRGVVQLRQRLRSKDVDRFLLRLRERVCFADRRQLDNPWVRDLLQRDAQEAMNQGTRGIAQDSVMVLRGWDFNLADIKVPVHVWQGCADTLSPLRCAHNLAESLPHGVLHTVRGQGHFFFTWSAQDIFRLIRQELRRFNSKGLAEQKALLRHVSLNSPVLSSSGPHSHGPCPSESDSLEAAQEHSRASSRGKRHGVARFA